jgi:Rieske Fe-S protein
MSSNDPSRRTFLKIGLILNGVVGALLSIPVIRFLLSPATQKPAGADAWISLGPVTRFPVGETRLASFTNPVVSPSDGATANIPCWVRRVAADRFQVFAINCAHLGCPVRWFPQSNLFLCPCHGGAYYADGARASGPPERGLFEYRHKIEREALWIQAEEMPTPGFADSAAGKRKLPCV